MSVKTNTVNKCVSAALPSLQQGLLFLQLLSWSWAEAVLFPWGFFFAFSVSVALLYSGFALSHSTSSLSSHFSCASSVEQQPCSISLLCHWYLHGPASGTEMDGEAKTCGDVKGWNLESEQRHGSLQHVNYSSGSAAKNGSQSRATFCHFTSQKH